MQTTWGKKDSNLFHFNSIHHSNIHNRTVNNEFSQDQYKRSVCFQGACSIVEKWHMGVVQDPLQQIHQGVLIQYDCDFLRMGENVPQSSKISGCGIRFSSPQDLS